MEAGSAKIALLFAPIFALFHKETKEAVKSLQTEASNYLPLVYQKVLKTIRRNDIGFKLVDEIMDQGSESDRFEYFKMQLARAHLLIDMEEEILTSFQSACVHCANEAKFIQHCEHKAKICITCLSDHKPCPEKGCSWDGRSTSFCSPKKE